MKQRIASQQQQRAAQATAQGGRIWWAIEGTVHHLARPVASYVPVVGGLVVRCVARGKAVTVFWIEIVPCVAPVRVEPPLR